MPTCQDVEIEAAQASECLPTIAHGFWSAFYFAARFNTTTCLLTCSADKDDLYIRVAELNVLSFNLRHHALCSVEKPEQLGSLSQLPSGLMQLRLHQGMHSDTRAELGHDQRRAVTAQVPLLNFYEQLGNSDNYTILHSRFRLLLPQLGL